MGRMTARQIEVLSLLKGSEWYEEVGTQPYSAPSIAHLIEVTTGKAVALDSVRNTLKLLESKGAVIAERRSATVATGLGDIERPLMHYWNAETMLNDKASADIWNAHTDARQDRLHEILMDGFKEQQS